MNAVVNIADHLSRTDNVELEDIVATVAAQATSMVQGAHTIGTALNRARAILGDDAAFGAWRVEFIEPMGISKRTAQRMQNIADRFTPDTLPQVGLSVLYAISTDAVAPMVQDELVNLAAEKAASGEALTAREATQWVARTNQGRATYMDIREEAQTVRAAREPVVIDNETQDIVPAEEQPEIPAPQAAAQQTEEEKRREAEEWAKSVRRTLKRASNGKQHMMLANLLLELRRSDLLVVADELTAVTLTDGKSSHIEVRS